MKKILLSVFVLSFLVPVFAFASFDVSLKYGSRGDAVIELQDFLQDQGVYSGKVDGRFGLGTRKSVVAFQLANGLTGDGYFGLGSRTKANDILAAELKPSTDAEQVETGTTAVVSTVPGCTSTSAFSPTTGQPCNSATQLTNSNLPAGCTSTFGFSITTGQSCNGIAATVQQLQQTVQQQTQALQQIQQNTQQIAQNTTPVISLPPVPVVPPPVDNSSASVVLDPAFKSIVVDGATNSVIDRFKVSGYGEDVKIQSLLILPQLTNCTPSCTGLNSVTVYFNGSQVGSSYNWNGSANITFALGSQMIIPMGKTSFIEIRADLQNYIGGTIGVNLEIGKKNAQGQMSHLTLNFPTSKVTGTSLIIQPGLLGVSKNTGYVDTSVSPNTANVKIGSFLLQNQSSSGSLQVTNLSVSLIDSSGIGLTSSSTPTIANFSNLRTSSNSGYLSPGMTQRIDVFADIGSIASNTKFSTSLVVASISQNSNDVAVTGQTITIH